MIMNELTEYGFTLGGVEVERMFHDAVTGISAINIKTNKTSFKVRVTKTGMVRFFDEQGDECKMVNKKYISELAFKAQNLKHFKVKS